MSNLSDALVTQERYSGGKLAVSQVISAAGNTTLVTPPTNMAVRVVWVACVPSSDNASANLVQFKFQSAASPIYTAYAIAHWEVFQGAAGDPFIVNLANTGAVAVTVHYRLVPA